MSEYSGLNKILVIRLSSLGDIVRLVPSLKTLSKNFGEITFLTEDRFSAILNLYEMAPRVILFPRRGLNLKTVRNFFGELRKERYDLVLDMHGILKSAIISRLAGGKEVAGFAKGFGKEFSHLFYHRKLVCGDSPRISRYQRYEGALKALGIEAKEKKEFYPPEMDEGTTVWAEQFIEENNLKKGYVFLFLGASKKQEFKRWPVFRFRELADLIQKELNIKPVFGWGPDEKELVSSISKEESSLILPLLDLKKSVALILKSKAFVGGDTGLMHLAALSGVKTVAVMGATDPQLNMPWGSRSKVVFKEGIKKGCSGENCPHKECMGKITEEEVLSGLKSLPEEN